jgi:pilus assembly protein CpaF
LSTVEDVAQVLRRRLMEEARFEVTPTDPAMLRCRIATLLTEEALPLEEHERAALVDRVVSSTVGLGPLEPLMDDPDVDEIMVNGRGAVHVERRGRIVETDVSFGSDDELMHTIERILSPLGRRVDEATPLADARLPDGSRVNCVIPPLSLDGPLLTIRRFRRRPFGADELIGNGTVSPEALSFLRKSVVGRKNLVVSGGTGSGKTTLLNVLSSFIPHDERVATIEDAAELQLQQAHVIRMETRPPNVEGEGEVATRDLVRNALRMRPDRIIVGECRSGEALDMLQAMNTGHDGSMSTGHANSPRDMLSRLETMVLMAGVDLPLRAIREQVASAVDLIVHQSRLKDGTRRITNITEVQGMEGDVIVMQDVFVFEQTGVVEGKIQGRLKPTGIRPKFVEKFEVQGINLPPGLFGFTY